VRSDGVTTKTRTFRSAPLFNREHQVELLPRWRIAQERQASLSILSERGSYAVHFAWPLAQRAAAERELISVHRAGPETGQTDQKAAAGPPPGRRHGGKRRAVLDPF
jgi:hypothetical protein